MSGLTPSQTVGPYYALGMDWSEAHHLADKATAGERIVISGHIIDGDGRGVPDAVIEIWQADAEGVYHGGDDGPGFTGFGRCDADPDGRFIFETIKPGRVPGPDESRQAPHVNVIVFARGLLSHLYTRIYFEDETAANAEDEILGLVPEERRRTLVASSNGNAYVFDIKLQGEGETIFLDV